MRLINTTTFELLSGEPSSFKSEGYAILSHRWIGLEISFERLPQFVGELQKNRDRPIQPIQLEKIRGTAQIARSQGLQWLWIDNVCINKASAVEEAESINSMFRWYSDARVCITYLGDVRANYEAIGPEKFFNEETKKASVWFTRGWTLQELLAPANMHFYDMNWEFIGTKKDLAPALEEITGISAKYLTGEEDFRSACIAAKMSWMAGRETARVEDIAYSMLGIFDITMSPQYGEGRRAFMRLQYTLLSSSTDESLFAWKMPSEGPGPVSTKFNVKAKVSLQPDEWGLLAASPEFFRDCSKITTEHKKSYVRPFGGFGITAQGVSAPISKGEYPAIAFIAGFTIVGIIPYYIWYFIHRAQTTKFTLNCWEPDETGRLKRIQLYLRPISRNPRIYVRSRSKETKLVKRSFVSNDAQPTVVLQPEF